FLLRREILEHQHGTESLPVLSLYGICRYFEGQSPQCNLDLGPCYRAARCESVEKHVAQWRGQYPKVLPDPLRCYELQNLLCAAIQRPNAFVMTDGDDTARHVRQNPFAEFLLACKLMMESNIA